MFKFELEGSLGKIFEKQPGLQINGAFILRLLVTPWSRWVSSSFGIGMGISHAFESPTLETIDFGNVAAPTLVHMIFEYTFHLDDEERWGIFLRIHHRSAAFGAVGGLSGGSNYLGLGVTRHIK